MGFGEARRRSKRALALCVAALALIATYGQHALAETVHVGNIIAIIEGGTSPRRLPRASLAPIALKARGLLKTADGSLLPPLKTITLEFDKHGQIYTKGLATCSSSQLGSTLASQAMAACGKALIGTGRVSAEIALPEQAPFSASGPLLIFNGAPKGGKSTVILYVFAHVPAPTTFVTTGTVGTASGQYGTRVVINIPTIVGGYGSVTSIEFTIQKTWNSMEGKKSYLLASCPVGRLVARGDLVFTNSTKLSGRIARSCTPIE
jgi:hypothetical protein